MQHEMLNEKNSTDGEYYSIHRKAKTKHSPKKNPSISFTKSQERGTGDKVHALYVVNPSINPCTTWYHKHGHVTALLG